VQTDGCRRTQTFTLWAVDDCGNQTAPCTVTYTWTVDTNAPTITCPPNRSICVNAGEQVAVPDFCAQAQISDNCDQGALICEQTPPPGTMVGVGSHVITLTVRDRCGNVSQCTVTFEVNENPTCAFNPPTTAGVLTGTISGGTGPYTCSAVSSSSCWVVNSCTVSGNTFTITYSVVQPCANRSATFTVTITDAKGCTTTCEVTVGAPTDCSIEPLAQEVCAGNPARFCVSPTGGVGPFTYEWRDCDGNLLGTEQCVDVVRSTPGPCIITATVTDGNGFTVVCEAFLMVNENPTCTFNPFLMPPCNSLRNVITGTISGGTPPYASCVAYFDQPGWTVTSCEVSGNTFTVTYNAGTGSATLTVVITDDKGCVTRCSVVVHCAVEFCTLTQGFYGNTGGRFNRIRTADLILQLIAMNPPLTVGKPGRSLSFSATSAAVSCLIARLPAGGPASTLPAGLGNYVVDPGACPTNSIIPLNPNGRFQNVLLGQTITLSLNVRLNAMLLSNFGNMPICRTICTRAVLPGPDGLFGTPDDYPDPMALPRCVTLPPSVLTALDNLGLPRTVGGLLELANRALAGHPTGGASLSDINSAVDALNRAFDGCKLMVECRN
ncbi:MAG: HYR domain-containing protein, partial [Fimbriimonadales bacterium]|nr:HYR domain-containing protein [Fimbriimonadales bacterium]